MSVLPLLPLSVSLCLFTYWNLIPLFFTCFVFCNICKIIKKQRLWLWQINYGEVMVEHLKHLIWVKECLWFIKGQLMSLMFYHHIKVIKLIIFCSSERYCTYFVKVFPESSKSLLTIWMKQYFTCCTIRQIFNPFPKLWLDFLIQTKMVSFGAHFTQHKTNLKVLFLYENIRL